MEKLVIALVLAGCGGKAVIDAEAGAGGDAPASTTTTSSITAVTSSTGAGGADGGCQSNADCAPSAFCDFPGDDLCGGEGTCRPRPEGCFADCPGICGCDGVFYCNVCEAQAVGVDMAGEGECVTYGAAYRAGEVDEMVLWRRSLAPPSCSVLRFWTGPPTPGIDVVIPPPWAATSAVASPEAGDCATPFAVTGAAATQAEGGVALGFVGPGLTVPCSLVFEAELAFEAPLPASVAFEQGEVPVVGGCF